MGDGFIQFLVIAVFVIITMMDGAARKRRKEAQRLGNPPTSDGLAEAADDPSEVAESPEGMVPTDLWEEIAPLARGEVPERGVLGSVLGPATADPSSTDDARSEMETWTAPQQDVSPVRIAGTGDGERGPQSPGRYEGLDAPSPGRTRPVDLQAGYLHPDQAAAHEEHAQVASPAQSASTFVDADPRPVERPHEFVPHQPEPSSKPQDQLRRAQKPQNLLARSLVAGVRQGAKRSLRDAIVVAEVLSPPVALRDSARQPPF